MSNGCIVQRANQWWSGFKYGSQVGEMSLASPKPAIGGGKLWKGCVGACAVLATPYARRITGGTIYVDGGVHVVA